MDQQTNNGIIIAPDLLGGGGGGGGIKGYISYDLHQEMGWDNNLNCLSNMTVR